MKGGCVQLVNMEELFFDIYERRFNPEDYQAAAGESTNTNLKQKEKERDSREERLNISRESC